MKQEARQVFFQVVVQKLHTNPVSKLLTCLTIFPPSPPIPFQNNFLITVVHAKDCNMLNNLALRRENSTKQTCGLGFVFCVEMCMWNVHIHAPCPAIPLLSLTALFLWVSRGFWVSSVSDSCWFKITTNRAAEGWRPKVHACIHSTYLPTMGSQ